MVGVESKKFRVAPFADKSGVFLLLIRKQTNKVLAKVPFTTQKETLKIIKRRIREFEEVDKITMARIEKVQRFRKAVRKAAFTIVEAVEKSSKPKRRRKKKKRKK